MCRDRPPLPPGPYLVVGLGRAGLAAANALSDVAGAEQVRACDLLAPAIVAAEIDALRARGVRVETATDGIALFEAQPRPACVVKGPGVPFDAPLIARTVDEGVPVLDELELGWRLATVPVVGVTGTNGKSTVAALIAAVFDAAGRGAPVVGNTEFGPPLSRAARDARDSLVVEASSYQLEGCPALLPEAAVLTNLRSDHLHRHGTMGAYGDSKRRLFVRDEHCTGLAVVNGDDPFADGLAHEVADRGGRVLRFGRAARMDFRLRDCGWTLRSGWLDADTPDGPVRIEHRQPGPHNAENALAAIAAARGLGFDWDAIAAGLRRAPVVPGRFEAIDEAQAFDVVVDFAHTPDAIDAVIGAARAVAAPRRGRIHVVISVAGNRPAELNEPIGAATGRLADTVIVSKGAMRSGSDATTIEPLLAGARAAAAAPVDLMPDRREAIRAALARAGVHDVVLILGRGARNRLGRNLAGDGPPFDDRVVAREELRALLEAGGQAGAATMRA